MLHNLCGSSSVIPSPPAAHSTPLSNYNKQPRANGAATLTSLQPEGTTTMSSDTSSSGIMQKADQIAFHFHTKLFYTINQARATEESHSQGKIDKWVRLAQLQSTDSLTTFIYSSTSKHPIQTSSQEKPVNLTGAYPYHVHHR